LEAKTPQGRAVGERKKHKKDTELTNLHALVLEGGGSRGNPRAVEAGLAVESPGAVESPAHGGRGGFPGARLPRHGLRRDGGRGPRAVVILQFCGALLPRAGA